LVIAFSLVSRHFSEGLLELVADALELLLFLVQLVLKTVNLVKNSM
jgi:hypothetical protein